MILRITTMFGVLVAQLLAKFDNFSGCLLRTNPIDQVPHSDLYPVQIGTIDGNACGSLGERIGRHGQARLFTMQCSVLGSQNATRILPWNHIPHLYVVCLEYINVQAIHSYAPPQIVPWALVASGKVNGRQKPPPLAPRGIARMANHADHS